VRTNCISESPGFDGYVVPFSTEFKSDAGTRILHLCSSPEFAMKRILAHAGPDAKIYQITKAFRMERTDPTHSPEFNMLEWYVAGKDYTRSMSDFEALFRNLHSRFHKKDSFPYQGKTILLDRPFERLRVRDIFLDRTGIDLNQVQDPQVFLEAAHRAGERHLKPGSSWDTIFFVLFLDKVERDLSAMDRPILLYDYPVQIASLARNSKTEPWFCERFECFVAGIELCNGYSELTDPAEHLRRFEEMNDLRKRIGISPTPLPTQLLETVRNGLPQSTGVALGMDRLCMLLFDCKEIGEIVDTSLFT
jgi:lysyl-tRNA synthetase class 2